MRSSAMSPVRGEHLSLPLLPSAPFLALPSRCSPLIPSDSFRHRHHRLHTCRVCCSQLQANPLHFDKLLFLPRSPLTPRGRTWLKEKIQQIETLIMSATSRCASPAQDATILSI